MMALSGVRNSCDMLARNSLLCWLATSSCVAFVLDLPEEPRVLDGQGRLSSEGLQQRDHLCGEIAWATPDYSQRAEQAVFAQEWHCQY